MEISRGLPQADRGCSTRKSPKESLRESSENGIYRELLHGVIESAGRPARYTYFTVCSGSRFKADATASLPTQRSPIRGRCCYRLGRWWWLSEKDIKKKKIALRRRLSPPTDPPF